MTDEIPQYGLRAYALFFTRHGTAEAFAQSDLDWIVKESMRKKIFALLLRSGWIKKKSRDEYVCVSPDKAIAGILEFKVPGIMRGAKRPYAFTGLSAIEIWSDYSYVQRSREKSPYFINVLKRDLKYWKNFFNGCGVPYYVGEGGTVGEYVILEPVGSVSFTEKEGMKVIRYKKAERLAKANDIYAYAYDYMRRIYGRASA